MHHLKTHGSVVFLHAGLDTIRRRIHNFDSRGIARHPGQSFGELFAERDALYSRYADLTLELGGLNQEEVAEEIARRLTSG